jgi:Terminase RNaseH-like domain
MSATDVLEMELGRKGGTSCQLSVVGCQSETNSSQLPAGSGQLEAAGKCRSLDFEPDGRCARDDKSGEGSGASVTEPEPSAEEIKELIDFMSQEKDAEEAQTAREKRLAKRREKIEDQLGFMARWGVLLDSTKRNCPIVEGGRTYQVAPREYLMREKLKIRNKRGRLESLKANAVQRDYAEKAAKRSIVLKARQLGITTYVAARFFLNCISRPGTMCVQVAHDQRSAEEIFRIVHRLLANLPEVLRKGVLATSHANKRQIIFPHLDSQYRVETADENAGRGLTIQYLHCSEVSRWPGDAEATLAALRAAVPPDGEIVLESTANGAAGCFYEEWQRAEQMGYSRHFYPWWWEPSYKREVEIVEFTEEELELMQKHKLTAEQIGFRRETKANFGRHAKEEFAEDAESCFLASGDCIFDVDAIEKRLHEELPVMAQTDGGRSIMFFPPQPGKEYIIGVDPAGGGSEGDYSCAQVIDRASGIQVAELRGHLTPEETAARVAVLARQYNKALVAVERNNHGHAVLGYLAMVHADVVRYHVKGTEGWLTSMATRPMMLRNLAGVLQAAPHLFNSSRLLEECKTFVRRPDGTTAAANGAHDDTVMAMAIALAVRAEVVGQASPAMEVGVGTL